VVQPSSGNSFSIKIKNIFCASSFLLIIIYLMISYRVFSSRKLAIRMVEDIILDIAGT
jgi:hypothetical protein